MTTQFNQQTFFSLLAEKRAELGQLLQRLIQIRSYSGEEQQIVEYIHKKMEEFGFDEAFIDGLGNVVGRIGNGPIRILYDAHIDTVRVTESESWPFPPFDGVISDGKIYGRGAVDEKPAMAGFLMAAKVLKSHFKSDLPFTLYIVGSVLEEDVDGYPLYHLIQNEGIRPDYVLLGEPTDLQVYRGQRGRMEIKISVAGKSAHGAHNQQGINAIYKMLPAIAEIEKLDDQLLAKPPLGKGSITVTQVVSRAPSLCSVPDFCQIHLDRRLTLNETRESAFAQLENLLKKAGIPGEVTVPVYSGTSWKGTQFQQEAYFPTWLMAEDHVLVQSALQAASLVTGKPARSSVWHFSTNGVATAGRFGIPTIGFAPGREELAHSTGEHVHLVDLLVAAQFYLHFPFQLCENIKEIGT